MALTCHGTNVEIDQRTNCGKPDLSLHNVGFGGQVQVMRLGGKLLCSSHQP